MPKQKYLSAEQLRITPEERAALLRVKRFIKTLDLPENLGSSALHDAREASTSVKPAKFYLGRTVGVYDCGTACCIGGWMKVCMSGIPLKKTIRLPRKLIDEITGYVNCRCSSSLFRLFFPASGTWLQATPIEAVKQIETFLTTGQTTW